jgi:guanylate kinase
MGRFVILSGPSCVGKGPLHAALKRHHPDLAAPLRKIVLHNSRAPRPVEQDGVDYHFRARDEIEALRGRDGFLVMDVRGDLQAVDLEEARAMLESGDAFFEGNPFIACELIDCGRRIGAPLVTAFLAPVSRRELLFFRKRIGDAALPGLVTDVMRRKLFRRTRRQKGILSLPDLENIERRASSAYRELQLARRFQHVLPNHDGEDSENWDAFPYPIGDAFTKLHAFVDLLSGRPPEGAERWEGGLVP